MKRGQTPSLTREQVEAIKAWASFGTSPTKVADKLGVSRQTVRRAMKDEFKTYWRASN